VVPDHVPGLGALGGIWTAVRAAPAPVVAVAWDMPFVTPALVRALAAGLATADACLPESEGRRGVEPLCAAYGPACDAAIARAVGRGDRRAVAFHDMVRVGILQGATVGALGDPAILFFNVNTAADLRRAEELARV
jgi:molybdopterin-guanine dinucleotide biosynthesis protein A